MDTVTAQLPRAIPGNYNSTNQNFTRTWDAKAPEQNPNTLMSRSLRDVQQSTQYFDGLGRPLQTVVKEGSMITGSSPVDLVGPVVYDGFGRETIKYLPFASTATGATKNDGSFKLDAFTQQVNFYNAQLAGQTGETNVGTNGENWAYGKTNFELSPLNRIDNTYAPGAAWVGSESAGNEADKHNVRIQYYSNTDDDDVKIWKVDDGAGLGDWGSYAVTGAYSAGELYKTIMIDEHDKQVIEFKDKGGKTILKKVQTDDATADNGTGTGYANWLCTYYIYDNIAQLRCVVQPKGVDIIRSNWVLNGSLVLTRLCARYEYDSRNRMIMKKVPGADPVYMVYDARDRLVMTQDGRNREASAPIWMVTLYDDLGRPVMNGSLKHSHLNKSFTTLLTEATQSTSYPFSISNIPSTSVWTQRITMGYDNFDGIGTLPSGLTTTFDATWLTGDYIHTTYNTAPEYAQPVTVSNQTRGMVTWTKSVVIGYSPFLYSLNFYDDKGRLIQVKSTNYSGGIDITTIQYNWAGQPLRIVQKHQKAGTPAQTSVVVTDMIYDDLGRLVTTRKKISNSLVSGGDLPAAWTTIAANEYDALGQLAKKKIGLKKDGSGNYTTEALANLEYNYNIRGWLTGINKDYIDHDIADRYFAQELGYDKDVSLGSFNGKQYNGNISAVLWKSAGDGQRRKYDFSYDALNRFTKGNFGQYVSGSAQSAIFDKTTAGLDFTEEINEYDAIGNIVGLKRYGYKLTGSALIDDLEYTYENGVSTKLSKVKDNIAADPGSGLGDFTDGANTTDDYGYNGNGSITKDLNKGISSIVHHTTINLPYTVTFANNKGNMEFFREASGTTLAKKVVENNATVAYGGGSYSSKLTTTTTYLGGFIYETKDYELGTLDPLNYKDKLQLIYHEEGRIRALYNDPLNPNTLTGFVYDYFIKDHLGNIRMVLTEEVKPIYYPAATLEGTYSAGGTQANSMINFEKQFYNIDNTKVVPESGIPSWPTESEANTRLYYNHNGNPPANLNYPAGCTPVQTDGSANLYRLNATTNKTGLEFVIKVMAGDKIDIFGKSYFLNTADINNSNSTPLDLLALMTNLLLGPSNAAGAKGLTATQLNDLNTGLIPSAFFRGDNSEAATTIPKAYINYIFFDEQFKYAGGNFSRVGTSGSVKDHWQTDAQLQNITVPKNGYIFVYVSNESNLDVFFDNLQVIHKPGPILEETHYYPYGMKMAGISSKAYGSINNPSQYQGDYSDFEEETGWNDFALRNYDAQTGRFIQVDPYDEFPSPYTGMGNNPVSNIDPSGGFSLPVIADLGSDFLNAVGNVAISTAIGYGIGYLAAGKEGAKWGAGIGFGLSAGSYVPWEDVGNWAAGLFNSSEWLDLTKSALTQLSNQYSNRLFTSEGAKQNYLGNMFENNWHNWAQMHFTQNGYRTNRTPDQLDDGQGLSIPGHSSRQSVIVDAKMTEYNLSSRGVQPYVDAHWFEAKAISRNVSLSTSNYQIQYEMDALASSQRAAVKAGVASYSIVTTANAAIGNSVYEYGNTKGLFVRHFRPQYKITNTGVRVRFGWEQSSRVKGVPIRLLTKYTYGLPVNMNF
jgi:RHS repeat-associated protein